MIGSSLVPFHTIAGRGQSLSVVGGRMPRDGSPSAFSLSAMDISSPGSAPVAPRLSKVEELG